MNGNQLNQLRFANVIVLINDHIHEANEMLES